MSAASDGIIRVDGLRKAYDGAVAVRDLSFTVETGEILGLVGPNGAGKTTTLRAIAGIIPPTAGRIRVAGFDLATDPIGAKRALAFVPDEPRFFDRLTVEEHLRFIGRLYGVADPGPAIEGLLVDLEIDDRRGDLPETLSRGMKQKLAIACGLVHDPVAILFDEPLTGLDPVAIRRIKNTIRTRAADDGAVVVSSHLLSLVEELADRVLVIQEGRKVVHGGVEEIRERFPDLEAGARLEEVFLRVTGGDDGEDGGERSEVEGTGEAAGEEPAAGEGDSAA